MLTRRRLLKRSPWVVALGLGLGLLAGLGALPAKAAAEDAKTFIRSLGNDAIETLANKSLTPSQREETFHKLFVKGFDVDQIARFALGRFWRHASEQEHQEYRKLFEDFIVHTYAVRFGQYSGETLTVKDERSGETPNDKVVTSQIDRPSGPPVRVDWKIKAESGGFKIVDVVVEGVSMSLTQRQEFASVIQNGGGKVEILLGKLRERTQAQ